jgi:hypothetical protein
LQAAEPLQSPDDPLGQIRILWQSSQISYQQRPLAWEANNELRLARVRGWREWEYWLNGLAARRSPGCSSQLISKP